MGTSDRFVLPEWRKSSAILRNLCRICGNFIVNHYTTARRVFLTLYVTFFRGGAFSRDIAASAVRSVPLRRARRNCRVFILFVLIFGWKYCIIK